MNILEKFIGETLRPYGPGACDAEVIMLTGGKYRGYEDGYEIDDLIYGRGMANKRVTDTDGRLCLYAYSDEGIAKFKAFCEEHSIHFYADGSEDFFIHKGVDGAIAAGKKYLMAENLS